MYKNGFGIDNLQRYRCHENKPNLNDTASLCSSGFHHAWRKSWKRTFSLQIVFLKFSFIENVNSFINIHLIILSRFKRTFFMNILYQKSKSLRLNAPSAGLRIQWLYPLHSGKTPPLTKTGVLGVTLNCNSWLGSSFGAQGSLRIPSCQ